MAIIEIAGLSPRDVLDFFDVLDNSVVLLDVLAQLQFVAGGLHMEDRARRTDEIRAKLERFARQLRTAQDQANR